MISKKREKYFRSLLNQKLEELSNETSVTDSESAYIRPEGFDFGDQANAEYDRAFALRLKERNTNLIQKLQDALERIDEGTFGICEDCGEEICERRLQARPTATLCVNCKGKQEELEKMLT